MGDRVTLCGHHNLHPGGVLKHDFVSFRCWQQTTDGFSCSEVTAMYHLGLDDKLVIVFLWLFYFMCSLSDTWDCNREWPSLELLLPIDVERLGNSEHILPGNFLQSFLIFWPTNISRTELIFLVDYEERHSRSFMNFHATLLSKYVHLLGKDGYHIKFSDFKSQISALNNSHRIDNENELGTKYLNAAREQLQVFYADIYGGKSDAEYIGFVKSDTLLVSYVDRGKSLGLYCTEMQ